MSGVDDEVAEELAGDGVDDADVEVLDELRVRCPLGLVTDGTARSSLCQMCADDQTQVRPSWGQDAA